MTRLRELSGADRMPALDRRYAHERPRWSWARASRRRAFCCSNRSSIDGRASPSGLRSCAALLVDRYPDRKHAEHVGDPSADLSAPIFPRWRSGKSECRDFFRRLKRN
jgi:hypothetical protein